MFMTTIYAILASSLNIAVGITGLPNLSHATFFGIGAYVAAIGSLNFNLPFYVTLFIGGFIAMVFGVILGIPTLRLKGFYLALVTIGFGQVIRIVELNWMSVTNGPMGLPGISGAVIGSYELSPKAFIYYGFVILLIVSIITKRLLKSKIGRALMAIKNDEVVANALGVDVTKFKVFAFIISSFFAGMAGTVYAHYVTFVSPDSFTAADSTTVLCMVILGGMGTILGPVIGAIVLTIAPEALRFADLYRVVFIGMVMVVSIIFKECNCAEVIISKTKNLFSRQSNRDEVSLHD
jgi:branched-chain amino acid transport system permease protein